MTNYQKALKLAKKFNLKVSRKNNDFEYDNGVMYINCNSGVDLDNSEFILHNIAHFIIASPERRYLKDFGLGNSPDSKESINSLIPVADADFEEFMTSTLSYLLGKENSIKMRNISFQELTSGGRNLLEHLKSYGVIDDNGITYKLRTISDEVCNIEIFDKKHSDDEKTINIYGEGVLKKVFGLK